ncbi:hypothetical protein F7731_25100 [Cytobacillus depressus]|uniref:Uncharacterized protein n=1 Tax=Cytobacillus depressus TaxID=1602942 RepID=A0A6L3V3W3_9BACI|nr:bifunctional adenosylcobinamide kinase/adenosylcobinamide-phosphate guanylyltransferase [Cytobacillus depressus]KAB2328598.1 hypothetical protein F7731_25100 [Cytobacillus depressus]
MHFVTGGAFNGKSNWVTEYYQLKAVPHLWISGYKDEGIPEDFPHHQIVILEGIEVWLKQLAAQYEIGQARAKWQQYLTEWRKWENEDPRRKLILIGTDMNKGIVPMFAEVRKWRDLTGWAYQDTAKTAEQAELIWYGVSQRIK